jgi:spore germination cell wall hydrolase CwlJ-like protein
MNQKFKYKYENAKLYARKYVFSSRFIVRNTLAVLAVGCVSCSTILAAKIVGGEATVETGAIKTAAFAELAKADKKEKTTEIEKAIEAVADSEGQEAEETYVINLTNDSLLDDSSVKTLYSRIAADGNVLTAANETNNLAKTEYDMTGKYIVATDGLNVRKSASEKSDVLDVLNTGDYGEVVGTDGEWTIVMSDDSTKGYVKSQFILTDDEATAVAKAAASDGITYRAYLGGDDNVIVASAKKPSEDEDVETTEFKETPTEELTTETPAEDKNDDKDDSDKDNSDKEPATEAPTTEEPTTETPTTEEPTTEAPTTEEPTTEEPTTEEPTTEAPTDEPDDSDSSIDATDDLYLLAAIVYAEAGGESYEGQLAVASVIMNRLANGSWGSSLSSVIYAPGQFTGTYTSNFKNALSTGGSSSCLQAAGAAMSGENNVPGCMYFLPTWNVDTSSLGSYTQIGNHVFW